MAATHSVKLYTTLEILIKNTSGSLVAKDDNKPTFNQTFADGTGLDQCNKFYRVFGATLVATTLDLDLSGSLVDALGQPVVMTKLKGIIIRNNDLVVGHDLKLGGGSAAVPFMANTSDILTIGPGGMAIITNPSAAGWAVTATTGDIVRLDAGSNTISSFDYALIGVG